MNHTYLLLLILLLAFVCQAHGQEKYTISGHIADGDTGEELIGATVTVRELSATGASSNIYGFYSITLPSGQYTLIYSYLGYQIKDIPVQLDKNTRIDVNLSSNEVQLQDW